MHADYKDIIERISESPIWWDEHAVPRYCEFSPRECANIYASEVALVEIQCQSCSYSFLVCFSSSDYDRVTYDIVSDRVIKGPSLAARILKGVLAYGDPPNFCCAAGATMTSIEIQVEQYWHRSQLDWVRNNSLEVSLQ